MKQTIDEKQFYELLNEFKAPIAKWQKKKPAKRNALLLFCDRDAGLYGLELMGNKRAKYPLATCLNGLSEALIEGPELLGWVKADVRFAERELKRKYQQTKSQEDGKGNS